MTGLRIVVNPNSGPALSSPPTEALREALPSAEVIELDGSRSCEEVLGTPQPSGLGVSGGDGTVAAAATVAVDLGVPLLVIPGGTLNHFARDLGITSTDDAIAAVRSGTTQLVDTATIDGHLFLNNASLGAYPHLVEVRERWEHRVGKWPALIIALIIVLRTGRPTTVEIDGQRRRLWFAFFGNCHYDRSGLVAPSGRSRLDDGLLDVRLVHADRNWARLRILSAAIVRRIECCSVYEYTTTDAGLQVRVIEGPSRLAADGEQFEGSRSFQVKKQPRNLRTYTPRPGDP